MLLLNTQCCNNLFQKMKKIIHIQKRSENFKYMLFDRSVFYSIPLISSEISLQWLLRLIPYSVFYYFVPFKILKFFKKIKKVFYKIPS